MNWKNAFFIIIFLFALSGCAQASESSAAYETADVAAGENGRFDDTAAEAPREVLVEEAMEEEAAMDADGFSSTGGSAPVGQPAQTQVQERLIIRNGNLSLIVEDTEAAIATISQNVESNGGWVVESNVYQYNETDKTGFITVRVPSAGFNSAIEAFKNIAIEVISESTSGQDVTDEFVDLGLRLDNLEATAERVRGFLEDTRNVEEALAVNEQLSRLEGEIELIKGRREYLSQSASFSTLTIELRPEETVPPVEIGRWRPRGALNNALESLVDAMQGTVNFLIWVGVYVLPIALLYGIPLYLVGRFVWKRWQRRSARVATPSAE